MYIYNMYILITLYTTILNIKHKEAHIYIYTYDDARCNTTQYNDIAQ
jgi:hypothetical protein